MTVKMIVGAALVALLPGEAQAATKLQRIFQLDNLNVRIQYFESLTGPAMSINDYANTGTETRQYKVEGCGVYAFVKGGNVRGLQLDLSSRCNFNIGAIIGNGYGSTAGLTVGKFASGSFGSSGIKVQADCIYSCGNAADPVVDFTWEGPGAANYVLVTLGVTLVSGPALSGVEQWRGVMQRNQGPDYVSQTRFNCDRKYDGAGVQAFSKAPVSSVAIGYDLPAQIYASKCR